MTTFVASILCSLDGFDANEAANPTAEEHQAFNDLLARSHTILFDRENYTLLVPYWDDVDPNDGTPVEAEFARIFRTKRRLVIDPDLQPDDPLAEVIRNNPIPTLTRLAQESEGAVMVAAGADLLTTLFTHHLIHEIEAVVRPLLLGSGTPAFPRLATRKDLTLLTATPLPNGTMFLHYRYATA